LDNGYYLWGMATKHHQYCAISLGAEVLATRWTLLVVRELLVGSRQFNDIARGLPGISRSMLTKRLRELEAADLVERLDDQYLPTEACQELRPVLMELGEWAWKWLLKDPRADEIDTTLLLWWAHSRLDTSALPDDRRTILMFHFTDVAERFWVIVERDGTSVCVADPGFDTDAVISSEAPTLHKIWHGRGSIDAAVKAGQLRFQGKSAITRQLRKVLTLDPITGLLGADADAPGPRVYRPSSASARAAGLDEPVEIAPLPR
jgi:DNA-binding HxlR family transcriptional regulator